MENSSSQCHDPSEGGSEGKWGSGSDSGCLRHDPADTTNLGGYGRLPLSLLTLSDALKKKTKKKKPLLGLIKYRVLTTSCENRNSRIIFDWGVQNLCS